VDERKGWYGLWGRIIKTSAGIYRARNAHVFNASDSERLGLFPLILLMGRRRGDEKAAHAIAGVIIYTITLYPGQLRHGIDWRGAQWRRETNEAFLVRPDFIIIGIQYVHQRIGLKDRTFCAKIVNPNSLSRWAVNFWVELKAWK
jgi:hypothetical protein